jgi:hypothetical protein
MADVYSGGGPTREDFMESVEDTWRLQEVMDMDASTNIGVNYGASGTGIAKILKPGSWDMTGGVISTDSFTAEAQPGLGFGGFVPSDPDDDPETQELGGLGVLGFRGEGMRGSNAARTDEGEYIGKAEIAVQYDSGVQTIETSTMGIGYVELSSTSEAGSSTGMLFFNYSTLAQEPSLAVNKGMVEVAEYTIGYYCENPVYYSESESAALRFKFGWDPTLLSGTYTDDPIKNAIEHSFLNIVKKLITTYPKSLATFPRTPPLRIEGKDIAVITASEIEEGDSSPAGLTATRFTSMPDAMGDTMTTDTGMGEGYS